jgi:hypothetical protein
VEGAPGGEGITDQLQGVAYKLKQIGWEQYGGPRAERDFEEKT